ncbi:MAG: ExeM/NucH family extracellular endonuclease [Actinomycetota bacterium]
MLPHPRRWMAPVAILALLVSMLVGPAPAAAVTGAAEPVFINELHYDNAGADVGEFVEVAGPAGTDLDGWTLVPYNGNGGGQYSATGLSGVIDDEGSGFGAVSFAISGLQNGSPDGIALVDDSGTVIQFLSYEGVFDATDGAASGQTSTDIGVSEGSSTPVGQSLQLTGTGTSAGDFVWVGPGIESPNTLNAGQTFGTPPPPDPPFIAEIHYDNDGSDEGEFVEIEGPAGTDLTGWTLVPYNGANGLAGASIVLSGIIDDEDGTSGAVSFPITGLQNGSPDGIALVDPADAVVEFLSYEGVFDAVDGPAGGQTSTDIGVSEGSSTLVGQSLQLLDGEWIGPAAASPGSLNTAPPPPAAELIIAEIHYDNAGGDEGEFVEIEGPAGADLTGWDLVLYNGSNGTPYNTIALSGTIDDEDGTSGAVSFPIPGLQNGAPDGLALVDPTGAVTEFLSYEGVITASGGPADGQTSTDIGVSEGSATPVGDSLQRFGEGWTGPAPASPGDLNGTPTGGSGLPFPLEENFSTDCEVNGWQIVSVDTDTDRTWSCSTSFNNADVNAFGGAVPAEDWFISPALDMEAQDGETLEFDSFTRFTDVGNYPAIEVLWSADYDGGGDPTTATWTALTGITFPAENGNEIVGSGPIDLSGIAGSSVYFAWKYTSTGNGSNDSSNWRVSAIEFGPIATGPVTEAKIHEVQGPGDTVAITDDVQVQAVVTSLFEDDDAVDGFFIQEEDADADADPNTSEAIFVFCDADCPELLGVGDLVTVVGTPLEFLQMSQIDARDGSITVDGTATLPTPVSTSLPAAGATNAEATFEAIEGMIVTIPEELFVSEYFELARFGEIVLTVGGVPFQYTDDNTPSVDGYAAFLADLATKRIILDDDNSDQNDAIFGGADEAYPWPIGGLSTTNAFRGGDSITGLTGVMHWNRQGRGVTDDGLELAWRIRPIQDPAFDYTFTANNPRPTTPPDVGGSLTVVSFNVLNYFNTLDGDPSCTGSGCRGADSAAELARQRDKIVTALAALDADIVGLIEIENDADVSLADLVAALNAEMGAGTYDFVATGVIGSDAIKVAFIYKPATVTAVGAPAILDSSVDPTFIDTKNRPVLVQTFDEVATGERFTAAVNHLKSKGSSCDDVGDPGLNDGQANCAGTRTDGAIALANYLATDPTGSGDPDFLIMGDINAYAKEDPIVALEDAGYTNLIDAFVGDGAYSFVFDGQRGYLDHALANPDLAPQVSGAAEWNINADEASLLDYNDDVQDSAEASFERKSGFNPLYDTSAFRSSDHDPVIVGLQLGGPAEVYTCGAVSGTEAQLTAAGFNVVLGDDGDNFLKGTTGRDFILGFDGRDVILAGTDDDVVCAGSSHDIVVGGSGDDYIDAEAGNDVVSGGNGEDTLLGGLGRDAIRGGDEADRIDGGNADDLLFGGNGGDTILGGNGSDDLRGNDGDDNLQGGAGNDILRGHGGTDTCDGGPNGAIGDLAFSCETVTGVP